MGRWLAKMVDIDGNPLEEMIAVCKTLGAEVRYSPEGRYFTATVWDGWGPPEKEQAALAIQKTIQCRVGRLSGVVCYCFDAFSTLVYEV